jgi:hypothetical protein
MGHHIRSFYTPKRPARRKQTTASSVLSTPAPSAITMKRSRSSCRPTAPVYAPYIEHVPPDVTAGVFWLKNRDPQHWRDSQQLEHVLGKYLISDKPMSEEDWARERATVIDAEPAREDLVQLGPGQTSEKPVTSIQQRPEICYLDPT